MAADTAALVVALSAQLTKFEKDMKQAVTIADQHTKQIENSFSKMNDAINNQLSGLANSFSSRLGPIGNVLGALGPVGLSVAAALGAVGAAFFFVTDKVDKFAEKARDLKEFADTTGLTTAELKALTVAAQTVGLDAEQAQRGIIKLATAVIQLREKGSGPLYDILIKTKPEFIDQVAGAENMAKAIDAVTAATKELTKSQKEEFDITVLTRRNAAFGRVFAPLAESSLTQRAQEQLDKGFSPELIERVAKLRQEIEAIQKKTDNIWGRAFAIEVLQQQKQIAELWLKIAEAAERSAAAAKDFNANAPKGGPSVLPAPEAGEGPLLGQAGFLPRSRRTGGSGAPSVDETGMILGATQAVDKHAAALKADNDERERQLRILPEQVERLSALVSILGGAATQAEQLKLKQQQLALAVRGNKDVTDEATRAEADFVLQQKQAKLAIEDRLGLATQQALTQGKLNQLNADAIKFDLTRNQVLQAQNTILREAQTLRTSTLERLGVATPEQLRQDRIDQLNRDVQKFQIPSDQAAKATEIALRDIQEAADKLAVRQAYLPGLKQLEIDAASARKGIDTLATQSLNTLADGFADVIVGTKSLSDAFKSMTESILRDLVRLALRQTVFGPLAGLLGGAFGGGGTSLAALSSGTAPQNILSGIGNPGWGGFPIRQSGGPVSASRGYIVGEHGTELFVPSSGGQIMPGQLTGSGGGSSEVIINNYVAADTETKQRRESGGPNAERVVIDIVKKAQARGELDDVNRGRFGLRPAKVR